MVKPGETGFRRLRSAFSYSMQGLKTCWRREAAFRQEVSVFFLSVPLALWLGGGGVEKALLIAVGFLVLIVELLNSGIEALVDRVGEEAHELSGMAKDLGSAAVFVSLLLFASVWSLLLLF